ncbi:hypothetical protein BGZ95_005909 [Linnemannia exigua]|uniref:Uncharacterized protein n=1 Tax=Linnemannia exigua TaxID=604196 RepID=A0AAD4H119_9FUNG|nr:hypothetical protein BGZ95_005909 [Linnemannia exigua]
MDTDKVSAAMGNYMLQGWTPLMRNREATSQICVNCQLNPPVDPEETITTTTDISTTPPATAQPTAPLPPPPAVAAMTTPAPTSALPSLPSTPSPGPLRPPSPQNHRSSTLDPMLEARRALRPVGARNIGGSAPQPPSTPPPRATTPLPMPPMTPPPPAGAKVTSGPLSLKPANIPRPPGPPPAAPLAPPPSLPLAPPPPAGTLIPTLVPRDMKRSPQSSIILSGPILPPSTPPPPPPSAITSGPLPSPPTGPAPVAAESTATVISETVTVEQPIEAVQEQAPEPVQEQEEQTPVQPQEQEEKQEDEDMEQEPAQEHSLEQAQEAEDEDDDNDDGDKTGVESDDDFEDAEEEVFKPSEDEVKERESKREQSERASRLIGQKMLQGWAMLQDPCPNLSCHGVPLLRNREKKEYCVVCENFFQREQDLEHGKYTIVNPERVSAPMPALPPAPTASTLPPPPQTPSPALPPQHQAVASVTSPSIRAASPLASPSMGRTQRDLAGRVSGSIILPPAAPMPASLASASQQILGKHISEDLDKLASEDEEARKHIQIIRKGGEYSNRSLPPVPSGAHPPAGSRPTSTYSTSSEYHPSETERPDVRQIRPPRHNTAREQHANGPNHLQQQQHASLNGSGSETSGPAPPPPAPLSPEVQALVAATHKTMATILVKLEAYRLALEVSESPKECQALTAQIKGLMECLKACRETL